MRIIAILCSILACLWLPSARAEEKKDLYKFPKEVIPLEQLDQAKIQAGKEKKMITFLITLDGLEKDNKVATITDELLDAVKATTVIVYINAKEIDDKVSKAPELVLTTVKDMSMKRDARIPIIILTDAATTKVLTSVNGGAFANRDQAAKFIKDELRKLAK